MNDDRASLLTELEAVRRERKAARQAQLKGSKIDRFKGELLMLHEAGASTTELAHWLATRKRTRAHPTTILRRLARWRQQG